MISSSHQRLRVGLWCKLVFIVWKFLGFLGRKEELDARERLCAATASAAFGCPSSRPALISCALTSCSWERAMWEGAGRCLSRSTLPWLGSHCGAQALARSPLQLCPCPCLCPCLATHPPGLGYQTWCLSLALDLPQTCDLPSCHWPLGCPWLLSLALPCSPSGQGGHRLSCPHHPSYGTSLPVRSSCPSLLPDTTASIFWENCMCEIVHTEY